MSQLTEVRGNEINLQNTTSDLELLQQQQGVDVWGILSRRKWLVILGLIIGLGLGYVYLLQADPQFESIAQVLIEDQQPPTIPLAGFETQLAAASQEAKHAIVLKSPTILQKAYEDFNLAKLPTFATDDEAKKNQWLRTLSQQLEVALVEEGTSALTVSFRGPNPDDAQTVVNSIVTTYQKHLEQNYKDTGQETRNLISRAQTELLEKLDTLNKDYREFKKTTPLMYRGTEAINIHVDRQTQYETKRTQLQQQMSELSAKTKSVQDALDRGADLKSIILLAEQDGTVLQHDLNLQNATQRQQYIMLVVEEEALSQRYGADHPDVVIKRGQLRKFEELFPGIKDGQVAAETTSDLRSLVNSYLESLRQRLVQITEEYASLDQKFTEEAEAAKLLQQAQSEDERFRDEIERTSQLFEVVVKSLEGMEMVSESKGYIYTVLASPSIAEKVSPLPLKTMPVAGMLGVLAGFGLAYLVDVADKAFRTPDEVSQIMRLPVVGHIPLIETENQKLLPGSKVSAVIVTLHRPKSPQAESYRAVRTALYFTNREQRHQVIQVTSPMPGDGKSTLAANLAVTIAQSGKSVLIMDCDFRRPTLHKVFGIDKADVGLASVVSGETEPADAMYSLAEAPNLRVMPCGPRPNNPSELLSSEQFEHVLDLLREQFDFVIVDTPPVLAVSDPCAVAARVDGVILTFRIHKRARPLATRARDAMTAIGANVIGVVVNGVDQEAGGYYSQYRYGYSGYRYAYNYRYGYGSYGSEAKETTAIKTYFDEDSEKASNAT